MKDMLLILILGIYVVWGYRLMGRLDQFLKEQGENDENDANDENDTNDQQHHDGK